jgi:hypothetical protein
MDRLPPALEYSERLRARESRVARHNRTHIRFGNIRLLVAIIFAVIAWLSLIRHTFSPWWLAAPVVAFVLVASNHTKILQQLNYAERAVTFYRNAIARVEDRWAGIGETGERFNDQHHVYASDLDLFGKGSLFELLSTARTRIGEEMLAQWLLAPSDLDVIKNRHEAVAELRELLDFREEISVTSEDTCVGTHPGNLIQWAESPPQFPFTWLRAVAYLLAAFAIAGAFYWMLKANPVPFLIVVVIEAVIFYFLRTKIDEVLHKTEHAFADLGLLSSLLQRIELQIFNAALLKSLRQKFASDASSAFRAVEKLRKISDRIYSRHNLFLRIIDIPLMYSIQLAFAADGWRSKHGGNIRQWLSAVGEMEALASLATYSYEHPDDPFPVFVSGSPCFAAENLGHPLLPDAKCVRNNVGTGESAAVLLISGSNMSGKSTMLRSVGINTVLAMAGAPVRAKQIRMTPLRVGASIRISDSLQEGNSHFYAEIMRLRQIVDLTGGQFPVLFLLDEVLQGTNSHDRRVGTEGILRGFLNRGAIGLVSTHDLALTEVSGCKPGDIKNMHFQDELKDGQMRFDYILRDGIVAKSNGLELMRSIGLDV